MLAGGLFLVVDCFLCVRVCSLILGMDGNAFFLKNKNKIIELLVNGLDSFGFHFLFLFFGSVFGT